MAFPQVTQLAPIGRASGKTPTYLKFMASYFHPDGLKLAQYHIRVYRVSDQVEFWNSGIVTATTAEANKKLIEIGYNVDTGGTALVYGTEYQWKIRVWDSAGKRTVFTGLKKFTPLATPMVPSGLTPVAESTITAASSGLPALTIAGTYSHPEAATIEGFQYQIRKQGETNRTYDSGEVTTGSSSFSQVYTTANTNDTPSTPPDLAWDTVYEYRVRTKDNSGTADTEWGNWSAYIPFKTASPPKAPTLVGPINGAVTFNTKPVLGWLYEQGKHASGNQTSAIVEIYSELDNSAIYGSPATLSSQATTYISATPISVGTRVRWRVKVRGYSGPGYSEWSEWGSFFVSATISVVISTPAAAATVTTGTFDVEFTYTGSFDLYSYRLQLFTNQAATALLYDTNNLAVEKVIGNPVISGDEIVHTLHAEKSRVQDGTNYWMRITVIDEHGQQGISALRKFTINYTPPATITGFSATPNV